METGSKKQGSCTLTHNCADKVPSLVCLALVCVQGTGMFGTALMLGTACAGTGFLYYQLNAVEGRHFSQMCSSSESVKLLPGNKLRV